MNIQKKLEKRAIMYDWLILNGYEIDFINYEECIIDRTAVANDPFTGSRNSRLGDESKKYYEKNNLRRRIAFKSNPGQVGQNKGNSRKSNLK